MFVLISNHFRKYFSVNAGVWLRMKNKFSGKYFQLTVCFSWFDPEMKWKSSLQTISELTRKGTERERKRERERERERKKREPRSLLKPSSSSMTTNRSRRTAPHQRRSSKDRLQRQLHRADRLQSPTTHTSVDRTVLIKERSTPTPLNLASTARFDEFFFWALFLLCFCMTGFDDFFFFFWVLFLLCFCIEEWYYIYLFGSWENVCNMCFLWYFQKHNQTPENIFQNIFWNATKHLFSFPENSISEKYFTWTKHSLKFFWAKFSRCICAWERERETPSLCMVIFWKQLKPQFSLFFLLFFKKKNLPIKLIKS